MKKFNYIYIALSVLFLMSCGTDYSIEDQGFSLEELPGYVAFDAPGTEALLDPEDVVECADDSTFFTIEVPTGTLSDVTVDYTFEGDAVFGTDFTVVGADASGGSIVIPHLQSADPEEFLEIDNVDLVVFLLTDGVADGDKTLDIVLESARNADGVDFAVGRGGTDFLKTATVNIEDCD